MTYDKAKLSLSSMSQQKVQKWDIYEVLRQEGST